MNKPLITIIIPAYNAETFIERCINSVDCRSNTLIDIIVINDGSTDKTELCLSRLAVHNKNLRIINKTNEGVSVARNFGIEYATGDYVLFVDADDVICANYLNSIIPFLQNEKPDLLFTNIKCIHDDGSVSYRRPNLKPNTIYSGVEAFDVNYLRVNAGGAFCKRDFIISNNLYFPEGIAISEDTIFFSQCQALAKSLIYVDVDFYCVYLTSESASRKKDSTLYYRLNRSIERLDKEKRSRPYSKKQIQMIDHALYCLISNAVYLAHSIPGLGVKELKNNLRSNRILPLNNKWGSRTYKKILLLNASFDLFSYMIKIKINAYQ